MLIQFRFKNCRSFYRETVLSLQATKECEFKEINTYYVNKNLLPKGENELLKSAIIFGGNASGKTNVIRALAYMKNVILLSASHWPITQNNETFEFYEDASNQESLYEVEIVQNSTYYKYGFTIQNGLITSEWLDRRKERLTNIFTRKGNEFAIIGLDKNATRLINLSPTSLFLSVGNNFHLEIKNELHDVINWFQNLLIVFEYTANGLDIYTMRDHMYLEQALQILRLADIGIKDIEVIKDKLDTIADIDDVLRFNSQLQIQPEVLRGQIKQEDTDIFNIDMVTTFDVYDSDKRVVGQKKKMLFKDSNFNSEGTIRLVCYLGWLLAALDQGRVIFVDEIDSKLHFLVADYLLKLFNSIDKNPKNAQIVCTAHSIMLMDEDMRRDQIYFTSKDKYGESILSSLSDFKNVRKTDLFSKKYLAGFYSKLPSMHDED